MLRIAPVFVLALCACHGGLATITVSDAVTTVVPAGTILESVVGGLGFDGLLDMDISQAQELQNQGVEPGDIQDVRLTSFVLVATDPPGADLSFLQSMTLSAEAPDVASARVAHVEAFPAGQGTVEFEIDDVDLTPYAVSRSMTLTTDVVGHRPDQETTIEARYSLDVRVTAKALTHSPSN